MKKQFLVSFFVGVVGTMFLSCAMAAPTVKKLGGANSAVRANTVSVGKPSSNGTTLSRGASVRANNLKTVKTSNLPTKTVKVAEKTTDSDISEARLSMGKYLHGGNSGKSTVTVTPGSASNDIVEMKDHISQNEEEIENIKQDVSEHKDDADVHVSAEEREAWNAKQDALTPGEGIIINENGVITAVIKIPVGSEDAPRTASMWIE